jgi:hypothetical protein
MSENCKPTMNSATISPLPSQRDIAFLLTRRQPDKEIPEKNNRSASNATARRWIKLTPFGYGC